MIGKNKRYTYILIGLTDEELDFVDTQSLYGRGAFIRFLINQKRNASRLERSQSEEFVSEYATWEDFEKVFDAYRDRYSKRLEAAAGNGHNIDKIIDDFGENLGKFAHPDVIRAFLTEKLEEVSNTN